MWRRSSSNVDVAAVAATAMQATLLLVEIIR